LQAETTIVDNFSTLYAAENSTGTFLSNDILPPEVCEESGRELMRLLDKLTSNPSREEPINFVEISEIQNALRKFENVLEGEYRVKIVFALSKKGLYSLGQLANKGEEMFPEYVHDLLPGIKTDLHDATRCIAFEVPTAAAFHLFRAVEDAVKGYVFAVRKTPVTDREKNLGLGGYKKILEGLGVDDRITSSLEQLIKLHRNPTIHPDVRVTNEEVLATLGMVESVIRIIAIDMQRRQTTPNISLDDLLPERPDEALTAAMLNAGAAGNGTGAVE
jgi:hypothetical protein